MHFFGIVIFTITLFSSTCFGQIVLIDPGHGGEDCGAKGKKFIKNRGVRKIITVCEKELTLKFSKVIQKKLNRKYKAYLTRSFDRTLSLEDRAHMVQKLKADIFISVHFNSSTSKKSNGFETFYLSNHDDVAVKRLEKVENKNAGGKEVMVQKILADLVIDLTAPKSKDLATYIHKELKNKMNKKYHMRNRGIRPAIFYVLALSKVPSILLEPGFLSNEKETKKILNKKFLDYYAEGIYQGVDKYFSSKSPIPLF
jgi:N-acetylmuramoyl-L-alanine amidase